MAMLQDYKTWWIEQMLSLVPPALRRDEGADDALVIALPDDPDDPDGPAPTAAVGVRRHRRTDRLGSFRLDGDGLAALGEAAAAMGRPQAIHLVLPAGQLMEKQVVLPLAAEREIERVVAFAMDRETPFTAEQVWWSIALLGRDKAEGKLTLRLSLVPRGPLEGLLVLLRQAGLSPTTLAAPAIEDGSLRYLRLVADGATVWHGRMAPLAAAVCAVLVLLVAATPFVRQALALGSLDERIEALKPRVALADSLRRRLDGGGQGGDILATEMARLGDPLKVLAATTAVLPDDTYLTEFSMRQRQVTLVGQSADAAQLIGALAHDASFQDPAFAAPVTRTKDTNRDVFSIKVEARP